MSTRILKNLKKFNFKCLDLTFAIKIFQIFKNSRAQILLHKFGQIYEVKIGRRKRKILLIKKVAWVNIWTFEIKIFKIRWNLGRLWGKIWKKNFKILKFWKILFHTRSIFWGNIDLYGIFFLKFWRGKIFNFIRNAIFGPKKSLNFSIFKIERILTDYPWISQLNIKIKVFFDVW